MEPEFPNQGSHLVSEMQALNPRSQTARELLTPGHIDYWELWHLYTKPSITQLLTVSTSGNFTQTTSKTKTQKQSSTDRSPTNTSKYTTSHSPDHQRENNSPPHTRTQAQITPNKKSIQTTQPTTPSKGKSQKEEGL